MRYIKIYNYQSEILAVQAAGAAIFFEIGGIWGKVPQQPPIPRAVGF